MPVTLTYPGVYIEEISSGIRTITGVATSITAFVGQTRRGPTDEPITINSFGDFERIFGGLWVKSMLGYAVRDFYLNGGSQAIIVRLNHAELANPEATPPVAATKTTVNLNANGFSLRSAYPGSWGNDLRARIDHATRNTLVGEVADSLFNLTIHDDHTGVTEQFRNLSITVGHPRQADKVLENESRMVRAASLPTTRPSPHDDPTGNAEVWADNTPPTNSKVADGAKVTEELDLQSSDFIGEGKENRKEGLYALEKADLFNILCLPPYLPTGNVDDGLVTAAAIYCEKRRAMLLVDPCAEWTTKDHAKAGIAVGVGTASKNAALVFPRLRQTNPLRDNQLEDFAPSGAVAGVFARTDAQRGVWKAPAGFDAVLVGVPQLSVALTDAENGELNPLGINCLRSMPPGRRVVWGARTLEGDDRLASEWKYIPVRRTALFIEESLFRGLKWVVFEPNDEPLWASIRLNAGAFMQNLFRQGAFQGSSPREAYFVKCDKETTTQNDINLGIVNIVVGFAPLKPAEFVVIKLQQMTGQIAV